MVIFIIMLLVLFAFFKMGGASFNEKKYLAELWKHPNFKKTKIDEKMAGTKHFWVLERILAYTKIPPPEYEKNGVLSISAKYRVPPIHALRLIFKIKYPGFNIREPPDELSLRDKEQLKIAYENDDYTFPDNAESAERAVKFEEEMGEFLAKHNIKFKTQEDIIRENRKAVSTPDFLLENHKIKWIDAKNFYAPDLPYIKKKIYKQANKYVEHHGYGLMVFRWGCNANYKLKNTEFISFNALSKFM